MALNRDNILAANDTKIKKVDVPEWGGEVYVKSLTGSQRDSLTNIPREQMFIKMLVLSLVDEEGKSLGFTDADIPALEEKNIGVLARVFQVACSLNGMTAEAVKEAAKN